MILNLVAKNKLTEKPYDVKQEKNIVCVPLEVKYFQKIETSARTVICKVVVSCLRLFGNAVLLEVHLKSWTSKMLFLMLPYLFSS